MAERATVIQELGDDWVVTMDWPEGVLDGGPARLVIEPKGEMPVGGVSSTVLRRIDFRQAASELRANRAAPTFKLLRALQDFEQSQLRESLSHGVTDDYLALLSNVYVNAVNRGQPKVNDYLAELIGRPTNTVRGHLWQARNKGLLSRAPGHKGGQLSEEAEALIEPYALAWLAELDKLSGNTGKAAKPRRTRPQKAIKS